MRGKYPSNHQNINLEQPQSIQSNHNQSQGADEYVKGLLDIPEHLMIESIIAIGYPDETKQGHSTDFHPTFTVVSPLSFNSILIVWQGF